ncbi:MAG: hypothetical protein HY698_06640 [Deltaproteobacteria bacterium]|nr:hypothetical protein [Deltaproteobacteria bacterium]
MKRVICRTLSVPLIALGFGCAGFEEDVSGKETGASNEVGETSAARDGVRDLDPELAADAEAFEYDGGRTYTTIDLDKPPQRLRLATSLTLPRKIKTTYRGDDLEIESFKTNYWVYKSIGGEVETDYDDDELEVLGSKIEIYNYYYGMDEDLGINFPVLLMERWKSRANENHVKLKEYAAGIAVKIKSNGDVTPGEGPVILPLCGVITKASVKIGSTKQESYITGKGCLPDQMPY